jgi:hypothetical protein
MLQRPAHRAIRREFGQIERGNFLNVEHFEDFCVARLNRKGENSGKFSL